jgi:capsular exopolysaccharide synthesis family protein
VLSDSDSPISEQYRSLRARIQSIRRSQPIRTLAITSALPGEGKTTTAMNLAASFGLDPERVTCLVDADMRTPSLHRVLPDPPLAGLAELLEGDAKLEEALVQIPDTRLWVLPVRALPAQPSELLASTRMAELFEELETRFEIVLVDSPPVLGLPDATTLMDVCDAGILVVRAGRASQSDLEATLERIDRSKLLGTVFNGSDEKPEAYGPGAAYGVDRR